MLAQPTPGLRTFLKYWLPVLIWMAMIFGVSTDVGSSRNTSRFIGPFLHWLIPGIQDSSVELVQRIVRKGAHMTEYAILTALVWRACRKPQAGNRRPWIRRHAFIAFGVAVAFASSDEWHQTWVPSREGQVSDVLIDSAGAALGLIGLWAGGRAFRRW